jgi:hypothetical protein
VTGVGQGSKYTAAGVGFSPKETGNPLPGFGPARNSHAIKRTHMFPNSLTVSQRVSRTRTWHRNPGELGPNVIKRDTAD